MWFWYRRPVGWWQMVHNFVTDICLQWRSQFNHVHLAIISNVQNTVWALGHKNPILHSCGHYDHLFQRYLIHVLIMITLLKITPILIENGTCNRQCKPHYIRWGKHKQYKNCSDNHRDGNQNNKNIPYSWRK